MRCVGNWLSALQNDSPDSELLRLYDKRLFRDGCFQAQRGVHGVRLFSFMTAVLTVFWSVPKPLFLVYPLALMRANRGMAWW